MPRMRFGHSATTTLFDRIRPHRRGSSLDPSASTPPRARAVPFKWFKGASIFGSTAFVLATLTSCAPADSNCPISAAQVSNEIGGQFSAKFNDFKHPADHADRNDRNCDYSRNGNGVAGSLNGVFIMWSPGTDLSGWEQTYPGGTEVADLGDGGYSWIEVADPGMNPGLKSIGYAFVHDGFTWLVTGDVGELDHDPNATDADIQTLISAEEILIQPQMESIARAVTSVTFGADWWK